MHPPLATPERLLVCGEFIQALQKCHEAGWWTRYTGACNKEKQALSMCLRSERVQRTERNAESAKRRRQAANDAWKELESD